MVELDHNDVVLINRVEANVDFQSVIDRFFSEGDLVAWISTELRNLKSEKRSKLLKFNLDRQLLSMDWHSAVHNKSRLSREVKGEGSAGWDFSTMKPVADFREVKKKQDRLLKELEDARREVRETKARMDKNKSENLQFMAECDSRQKELEYLMAAGPDMIRSRTAEAVVRIQQRKESLEARRRKKLEKVGVASLESARMDREMNKIEQKMEELHNAMETDQFDRIDNEMDEIIKEDRINDDKWQARMLSRVAREQGEEEAKRLADLSAKLNKESGS
jgi:hypothetical protein